MNMKFGRCAACGKVHLGRYLVACIDQDSGQLLPICNPCLSILEAGEDTEPEEKAE